MKLLNFNQDIRARCLLISLPMFILQLLYSELYKPFSILI